MERGRGDLPPSDRLIEKAVVHAASRMVNAVASELLELEKKMPASLDGYLSELAEELAGVTVEWVRRGPRR